MSINVTRKNKSKAKEYTVNNMTVGDLYRVTYCGALNRYAGAIVLCTERGESVLLTHHEAARDIGETLQVTNGLWRFERADDVAVTIQNEVQ
jgi:hypothetical protein